MNRWIETNRHRQRDRHTETDSSAMVFPSLLNVLLLLNDVLSHFQPQLLLQSTVPELRASYLTSQLHIHLGREGGRKGGREGGKEGEREREREREEEREGNKKKGESEREGERKGERERKRRQGRGEKEREGEGKRREGGKNEELLQMQLTSQTTNILLGHAPSSTHLQSKVNRLLIEPHGCIDKDTRLFLLVLSAQPQGILRVIHHHWVLWSVVM